MTVRISTEWGFPLEEVASWSWRKKELYANGLAELNRHDQERSEEEAENRDVGSGGAGMGGDVHPALQEYENVSKMH